MSRVDIFLDNYVNGYKSGQNIVGRVQCTFKDEKTVKGLVLKFKGTAKTSWSETETYTRHDNTTNSNKTETRTVYYGAEESVLHHEINLLPQAEQTIPAGVHSYPFTYVLPTFIPSSFDGPHGKIVYKVKATVRRPTLKMDYDAESPINVVGLLNLNDNSTLSNPILQRKEKDIGCCCWKSGPFKFEWNMPYTGFVPGQIIPLNIEIENLSNKSVEKVSCKIDQEVIFKDKHAFKVKKSYNRIAKVELGGVGAHGERTYHDIFTLPSTVNPPNFQGCSIMEVYHTLTVEAEMPSCTRDISRSVPITIGHIPLAGARIENPHVDLAPNYNSTQSPTAPIIVDAPTAPSAPGISNAATAPSFNAPNYDPPSYSPPGYNAPNFNSTLGFAAPGFAQPDVNAPNYSQAGGFNPNFNAPPYPTDQPAFGWKMPTKNSEEPPPEYDDDMVFVEKPTKS